MNGIFLNEHQLEVLETLIGHEIFKLETTDLSILSHPVVKSIVSGHIDTLQGILKILQNNIELINRGHETSTFK